MILWMCGLATSMIIENIVMKMFLIFIPLAIFHFFTIVGFLFDRDIIVPSDIQIRLEDIINNLLAEHFAETQQLLYPSDFEVSISMEMDIRTNKVIISTYMVNADDSNLHTEIDTATLHDYGSAKKYFFNELGRIVLNRIGQLQKAANFFCRLK